MNTKRSNKGFTMMEVLIAVAVLVILMSVAFVAVNNHQRSTKRLELDATAREIFVAAQNHLTMAQSQGNLESLTQGTKAEDAGSDEKIYCFYVDGPSESQLDPSISSSRSSMLYQMLPQFSIDDTVRRGGRYLIKYNLDTATVLDVFYSDTSNQSNYTFTASDYNSLFDDPGYTGDDKASNRLAGYNGSIIGWYGGDDIGKAEPAELAAPSITIRNAERLTVELDATQSIAGESRVEGLAIQLVIQGTTSGATRLAAEFSLSDLQVSAQQTVVLDDITTQSGHFAQQSWCEDDKTTADIAEDCLIPGEDVTVYARAYSNSVLSKEATSAKKRANSLFASIEDEEVEAAAGETATTRRVANIDSIRHLENLDPAISGYNLETLGSNAAYAAAQISDLQWSGDGSDTSAAFLDQIEKNAGTEAAEVQVYNLEKTATTAGTYAPVNPTYVLEYDGQDHTIATVKVSSEANAGIFGTLDQANTSVHDLRLVDPLIASTSNAAGALVGSVSGAITITDVLAYNSSASVTKANSAITGSTAAGGLIGSLTGATLTESGAALYVEANGTGNTCVAGGLVGTALSGTITKSYSAGHLIEASTTTEDPKQITYDTTAGNVLASGTAGIAGGLVGSTSSTPVLNCYSTCSAFATNTAGGLVGSVSGSSVQNCYATGLVGGKDGTTTMATNAGAFAGVVSNNAAFKDDSYLAIINEKNNVAGLSTGDVSEIALADADTATYRAFCSGTNEATPYATVLTQFYEGKYNFKTADELASVTNGTSASATHYGDWPTPETLVLNTKGAATVAYQLVLNPTGDLYVGTTGVTVTLQISRNGGEYVDYDGEVTWTSSDESIVKVSGTTQVANLTLAAKGEATITAFINGTEVASTVVTVLEQASSDLVPIVGAVDHANGYLAYKEMNTYTRSQSVSWITWESLTDVNGVEYLALNCQYGYSLIYYNGTYYKPVDTNNGDQFAGLSNVAGVWGYPQAFDVSYLGSGEYYIASNWKYIKWVEVEAPNNVPDPTSGPGTRDCSTDTTEWNYRADRWLNNSNMQWIDVTEWEPFRDGCMVAVYHTGETIGAVWYNGSYYIPQVNGKDAFVSVLGTSFTNSHLTDGASHVYNSTTVTWLKIPNPYNQVSSSGSPEEGNSLTSDEMSACLNGLSDNDLKDEINANYAWYQYRDGCYVVAYYRNSYTAISTNTPIIWFEGHYYRPTGLSISTLDNVKLDMLNHYFYTEHLNDGAQHDYGTVTVQWERVS